MAKQRPRTGTCYGCGGATSKVWCSRRCYERAREERFREEHGTSRSTVWARSLTGERREAYLQRCREEAKRSGYTEAKRTSDRARRARKLGAYTETVRRSEIAKRDRWRCYLCDEQIDKKLSFPDPMSLSIDHVIPLAVGGTHEASNLRSTHLRCNISKGARPADEPGQMMIDFGRTEAIKPKPLREKPLPVTYERSCPVCSAVFTTTHVRKLTCSADCSRAASAIKTREKYQPKRRRHPRHLYEWARPEEVC